ncbi:MAG: hypothetical protein KTR25_20180 [Myxococcales bacterium]|nr:hypothetical protein [Myxococcales bacterium]
MSQKTALIIDFEREYALRVAAALRGSELKVTLVETEGETAEQVGAERPDVVIIRASNPSGESGFVLCTRLKRSERLGRIPVILYDDEEKQAALDTHREQEGTADGYVTIDGTQMRSLKEQVDQVLAMVADNPPPLPSPDPSADLGQEDTAFIEKVADSISHVDPGASLPPPVAKPRRGSGLRTTADAKLDLLRQKLRQREAELAKLMQMYRSKEREYHEWNEKLVERDVEAQSLRMSVEELTQQAEQAQNELDYRTEEFNASFEQLLDEKVSRENELIQIISEKEKDLSELETLRADAERAAAADRDKLETQLADVTLGLAERSKQCDDNETSLKQRTEALKDATQQLEGATTQIECLSVAKTELETSLEASTTQVWALEEKILEVRQTLVALRDEAEEATRDHEAMLAERISLADDLREDLTLSEQAFTEAKAALETKATEIGILNQRCSDLGNEIADLNMRLSEEAEARTSAEASLGEVVEELKQLRENERQLLEDLEVRESQFGEEVQRKEELLEQQRSLEEARDSLEESLASLREEQAEVMAKAEEQRLSLEAEKAQLQQLLQDAEESSQALEDELRQQLAQQHTDLENRMEQLDALERAVDVERRERTSAERMVASLERTSLQLQEDLSTERKELRSQSETLVEVRAELAQKIGRLETVDASLKEAREELSQKLELAKNQLSELTAEVARREEGLERVQDEFARARTMWSEDRLTLVADRERLQERAEKLRSELDRVTNAYDGAQGDMERVENELESLRASGETKTHQLETEIEHYQEQSAALQAENEQLQRLIEENRSEYEETCAKLRAENQYAVETQGARSREAADELKISYENRINEHLAKLSELESSRAELQALQQTTRQEADHLSSTLLAERTARKEEIEELKQSLTAQASRLEEASAKAGALAAEKRAAEERLVAGEGVHASRLSELEARLEDRRGELDRVHDTVRELEQSLQAVRQSREELESRYLRELEDVHESYMSQAQELDVAHSLELDDLRAQVLEAKRNERTSQLAAQRMSERLQKLEGRPARSNARAEFENFIAQVSSDPGLAVPNPGSARARGEGPIAPTGPGRRSPARVRRPVPASTLIDNAASTVDRRIPSSGPPKEDESPTEGASSAEIEEVLRKQFEGQET